VHGAGRVVHHQSGSVYWSPRTGARAVVGSIRAAWTAAGAERSPVGYPTSDELAVGDGRGQVSHFERGSYWWTPSTGAHEVRGSIAQTWLALGGHRSALGYPRSSETGLPDGRGRVNRFEGGEVYWSPTTGAHEVRGAIRQRWQALGAERGALGYPTSSERAVPGGRAGSFERGTLTFDTRTGAVRVSGPAAASVADPVAAAVHALTDAERVRAGLGRLAGSPCAQGFAQRHADALAAGRAAWAHQPLTPVLTACGASTVGENISRGWSTPEQVVAAWMASSGHRANLLRPAFTRAGIGVARSATGTVYVVQVLARH